MADLARSEYPALLANLLPSQAVNTLTERVRRINKINLEVADWMQERRRIEEQYVLSLRKLAQQKIPGPQSELGVFAGPWSKVTGAVETIAKSHHELAQRIEQDIENPLRAFQQRNDYTNINTISVNLTYLARDLESAQDKSEKVSKRGGKASAQKVDEATATLESAQQEWESQAPFVFESLQVLDESRVNHLRDLLTQYQTHESDQAQRIGDAAGEVLAQMLEISTEQEILEFAKRAAASGSKGADRPATRKGSSAGIPTPAEGRQANIPDEAADPYPLPRSNTQPSSHSTREDSFSEKTSSGDPKPGRLRRLGTMFGGRKRQSTFGPLGQSSLQKGPSGLGRLGSSHGRGLSPRESSNNLYEANRMAAVQESDAPELPSEEPTVQPASSAHDLNGTAVNLMDSSVPSRITNGVDVSDVPPPPGPPPSHQQPPTSPVRDSEGFTIPVATHDPISEAQREASGEDADQLFKLNIQNSPLKEEDPEEKQAALSSVANSLKHGPATRRLGTIRGRRDVRNTVYIPSPTSPGDGNPLERSLPAIPGLPSPSSSAAGTSTAAVSQFPILTSESSITAASDTQSVRSGHSLGTIGHIKHPELTGPGLQSSIIETVSATFEDGIVTSISMAGEIAFVNNQVEEDAIQTHETIRINNFPNLEKIGPNRIFVENASPEHPDHFILNSSHLSKTAIAFSYRVFAEPSESLSDLSQNAPLLVKLAWKPQGDKLGLLLQYQLNPASGFPSPVALHNVAFVVTYEGNASGAQTKPSGTHLRDKHLVYWRIGDVSLTSEPQKIICRIIGAEGAEPKPGHVEARWDYTVGQSEEAPGSGISISRLEEGKGKAKEVDPFADDGGSDAGEKWTLVPTQRKLIAGKYEAK